jgi:heavy metal translocating P-type ATPase
MKMSASALAQANIPAPSTNSTQWPGYSHETYIAAFSLAGVLLYLVLRFVIGASPLITLLPLFATLMVGGLPLLISLARSLASREFGADVLAGLSIVTSVLLGEYLVGAIIVLMLSGGVALEHYATRRASSVLDALAKRMPRIAHKRLDLGIRDISLEEVSIGETLIVLPHEYCPVDGTVIDGHGTMDESYLTGEPFEMSKAPGSQVLSGAVNGENVLTIKAMKLPVVSRYARIMQVMREAEQKRPRLRRLGDRLSAWYTPAALIVAAAGWIVSGNPDRFLAVIVIATPCPLLIGIPIAVIGAISLAARRGIIIKNPAMLEQIDQCRTLIFDKTGTLTYGRPSLTEIICSAAFSDERVLTFAASLEQYSKHPLAQAILKAADERKLTLQPVSEISERPGEGMRGIVDGQLIRITGRSSLIGDGGGMLEVLPPTSAGLECLVFINDAYAAALRFRDEPRHESGTFVKHLSPRHDVSKVMLVSGDRESEVRYLAGKVGITEVHSGKSPEDKVEIVTAEAKKCATLFVGDGINDAPAMQAATVGVAFGQNSDITSEAADAVIMDTSLRRVDELIHIGQRMRVIALESAVGGMALSTIGMFLAALGYLPPVAGAVTQEIIDVLAIANALRVTLPVSELTDF